MNSTESHTPREMQSSTPFQIGWAACDITPERLPVFVAGQFPARVSEGVADPLTATVLVLDSGGDQVIFVSCDVIGISQELLHAVRLRMKEPEAGLNPEKIIFHATHTHTAPEIRLQTSKGNLASNKAYGVELPTIPAMEYLEFLADRLVTSIRSAWSTRKPGRIAFGLDYAVVGRNRRWVDANGTATMYQLNTDEARQRFRHIEGYEDHSVNLLATYDEAGKLTGVLINLPSPSQETEHDYRLSADFWCETRRELRAQLGGSLFILPQCSAAGDLTSHLIFENAAHERMLALRGRDGRSEIASRIAAAVLRILPAIEKAADASPGIVHKISLLELPANRVGKTEAEEAREEVKQWTAAYEQELAKLEANPSLRENPRWYINVTKAFRRLGWYKAVVDTYEEQQQNRGLTQATKVHVVKVGDIAFASNPFEYYLDFGIQIKVRSPFIQTFLIQLAGRGTYVPSPRSVSGGGYGSVAASNPVGAEGGQILADHTIEALRELISESLPC